MGQQQEGVIAAIGGGCGLIALITLEEVVEAYWDDIADLFRNDDESGYNMNIPDNLPKVDTSHLDPAQALLVTQIVNYQRRISPKLRERLGLEEGQRICRYTPTCSTYAREAIEIHGSSKGVLMTAYRILRCNPLAVGGDNPVKKA